MLTLDEMRARYPRSVDVDRIAQSPLAAATEERLARARANAAAIAKPAPPVAARRATDEDAEDEEGGDDVEAAEARLDRHTRTADSAEARLAARELDANSRAAATIVGRAERFLAAGHALSRDDAFVQAERSMRRHPVGAR